MLLAQIQRDENVGVLLGHPTPSVLAGQDEICWLGFRGCGSSMSSDKSRERGRCSGALHFLELRGP